MGDNNNKDIFFVLVGVGITLLAVVSILSFLTYRRVEHQSWKTQNMTQQLGPNINTLSPLTLNPAEIPVRNQPVYDERLYQLLENQQVQIEHINSNINSLKSLNYAPGISNINKFSHINKLSQSRAGSVTSIKTTEDDKIRQKDFGMI